MCYIYIRISIDNISETRQVLLTNNVPEMSLRYTALWLGYMVEIFTLVERNVSVGGPYGNAPKCLGVLTGFLGRPRECPTLSSYPALFYYYSLIVIII